MTTAAAVDQVSQVTEAGAAESRVAVSGATPQSLCGQGAKGLRPRFTALDLRGSDTVTLTGSSGGSVTLTLANWPGKAFHTGSLNGGCVSVAPKLADPASTYAIDSFQSGTSASTMTVVAVGDLCGPACDQTAKLAEAINPDAVITAGDNAYSSGTLSEFKSKYDPYWGKVKAKTFPATGNHEYETNGAAGYFFAWETLTHASNPG